MNTKAILILSFFVSVLLAYKYLEDRKIQREHEDREQERIIEQERLNSEKEQRNHEKWLKETEIEQDRILEEKEKRRHDREKEERELQRAAIDSNERLAREQIEERLETERLRAEIRNKELALNDRQVTIVELNVREAYVSCQKLIENSRDNTVKISLFKLIDIEFPRDTNRQVINECKHLINKALTMSEGLPALGWDQENKQKLEY